MVRPDGAADFFVALMQENVPVSRLSFPLTERAAGSAFQQHLVHVFRREVERRCAGRFQYPPGVSRIGNKLSFGLYDYMTRIFYDLRRAGIIPDGFLTLSGRFCKIGAFVSGVMPQDNTGLK